MTIITQKLTHPKQYYTQMLHNNICVLVFEKADGTERTMICTTKSDLTPVISMTGSTRVVPDNQVCVFDVQKKAWRSFTTNSVISFTKVPE